MYFCFIGLEHTDSTTHIAIEGCGAGIIAVTFFRADRQCGAACSPAKRGPDRPSLAEHPGPETALRVVRAGEAVSRKRKRAPSKDAIAIAVDVTSGPARDASRPALLL